MIKITHIMYSKKAIGIALHKLKTGINKFTITVRDKSGDKTYPNIYIINKEDAVEKYGISVINKKGLKGIWLPLDNLEVNSL